MSVLSVGRFIGGERFVHMQEVRMEYLTFRERAHSAACVSIGDSCIPRHRPRKTPIIALRVAMQESLRSPHSTFKEN